MLNNDPLTPHFVGGHVYQAFLSATDYHRWHSPVNGKVIKKVIVPGTYYAESPHEGFSNLDQSGLPDPDPSGPNLSQGFITSVAARALIFIQANNPKIGLMCFMAVGMAEVSSCDILVNENDTLTKGQPMGMFHFGGSTHCLLFRPETNVQFVVTKDKETPLSSVIGTVQ
jgi:phosphatidylserine decarboxylase